MFLSILSRETKYQTVTWTWRGMANVVQLQICPFARRRCRKYGSRSDIEIRGDQSATARTANLKHDRTVSDWQMFLKNKRILAGTVDGVFRPESDTAVLTVNGIGTMTKAWIDGYESTLIHPRRVRAE